MSKCLEAGFEHTSTSAKAARIRVRISEQTAPAGSIGVGPEGSIARSPKACDRVLVRDRKGDQVED
jgi:hypothetical protein